MIRRFRQLIPRSYSLAGFRRFASSRGQIVRSEFTFSATPNTSTNHDLPECPPESSRGFEQFKLHPRVLQSIMLSGIHVPTACQVYGIPTLLSGENLLLISQTGKGKTLAYLIPIINKLMESDPDKLHPSPNKPRAIVVLPTRELVEQAVSVCRKMFGSCVSTVGLAPGLLSFVKERRVLNSTGADIVFSTPSRIQLHLQKSPLSLSYLQFLVVDEADTLCDSVYEQSVSSLIHEARKSCHLQIAIVGATKTAAVNSFVASISRKFSPIVTSDAHTLVPGLDQEFVTVGRRKRTACLSEILGSEKLLPESKILVFTNSVRTCNFVSRYLGESGIDGIKATSFHGRIPPRIRSVNYKKFTNSSDTNVLVCTNLASRGIDLDNVTHVVMYDFPHTLADYIHRAGRTARAGRLGKVTALVTKKDAPLVCEIQQSIKFGKPIDHKKGPPPTKKSVKIDQYKSVLEEFRRSIAAKKPVGMTIRGLRAKMGLAPHDGIGSVDKRKVANQVRLREKEEKELKFLKKRKRVGKKINKMPKLPDRRMLASETGSANKMAGLTRKRTSGDLQFLNT